MKMNGCQSGQFEMSENWHKKKSENFDLCGQITVSYVRQLIKMSKRNS